MKWASSCLLTGVLMACGGSAAAQPGPADGEPLALHALQQDALNRDPRTRELEVLQMQADLRLRNLAVERYPSISTSASAQYQTDVPTSPFTGPEGQRLSGSARRFRIRGQRGAPGDDDMRISSHASAHVRRRAPGGRVSRGSSQYDACAPRERLSPPREGPLIHDRCHEDYAPLDCVLPAALFAQRRALREAFPRCLRRRLCADPLRAKSERVIEIPSP